MNDLKWICSINEAEESFFSGIWPQNQATAIEWYDFDTNKPKGAIEVFSSAFLQYDEVFLYTIIVLSDESITADLKAVLQEKRFRAIVSESH